MRAEDIAICARWLAGHGGQERAYQVQLVAVGEAAVPALHAAALEPELFERVTLRQGLASWADLVEVGDVSLAHTVDLVHGVLREYDLPDLVSLVPPDWLRIEDPAGPSQQAEA